jgi:Flp pilus assembly protein TadB
VSVSLNDSVSMDLGEERQALTRPYFSSQGEYAATSKVEPARASPYAAPMADAATAALIAAVINAVILVAIVAAMSAVMRAITAPRAVIVRRRQRHLIKGWEAQGWRTGSFWRLRCCPLCGLALSTAV